MGYRWEITRAAVRQGVVGIVRTADAASAVAAARAVLDAGLKSVEIPLTNAGALVAIEELSAAYPDATIGAGTVLDESSATAAIRAGAQFLVSPSLHTAVLRTAHRYGIAALPGTGSVTEIVRAMEEGADAVKVFPASALGPQWIKDVRAALPQAPLVPTGGIAPEDVPRWLDAGAVACGIGSALTRGSAEDIRARVAALVRESL
ncbi:bifunctional 4-hydroxy-2-oxoglutarate aldolase/2-dehydro-3-deoxy-phosphogluconate aldolase [Amycolatopsis rubida]|uniref:Bifunctional 4-hydroxy-2-oxoglutarate aldolase/2-dehydro-3-deoxy-phosphogluconate aldolase n=1 Tax=Amycolatopsis rubida TaxID=112413 RepID=A0ABX0BMZ4_9PSEU|nr:MULTISPECIES: bifunctional 4-hydroxy-2-oxoglutarate aldolase/2-dehydro-3-deoxy-phosphogluconate aldolase [Amycolatopsis]MYW92022.1 bifunctional 4-hydroxy-2-oxoglutarate aldolase/2-dehydro-3-deoxy-phosphogluconate aldolase [Amycolatopsis rubida]NEC57007.1 bifunctional 4-hydroxy-2-oxoglutarate aldolase/2-dehydro-3-deoxy-phosphogluconate aldolase [Amycolatopsis rubida]OAP27817.1 2-dehydro-3-deoxy-6-phosphogalactonate aldolase [Amycolatopsis sp. M39]